MDTAIPTHIPFHISALELAARIACRGREDHMPLYGALSAWCRREIAAPNERHHWTPRTMQALPA